MLVGLEKSFEIVVNSFNHFIKINFLNKVQLDKGFKAVLFLVFFTTTIYSDTNTIKLVTPEAEFSAKQITELLYKAQIGSQLDLSHRDLTYLDLSHLDFKGARFSHSDLYGTDFTEANLKGSDLSWARLDRTVLIRTNLSYSNLESATLYRPTIYSDLNSKLEDAPQFIGANLKRIKVQAELSGANFHSADLSEADFHPLEDRPGEGTLVTLRKNVLKSCEFSEAKLISANFSDAVLTFSDMKHADLTGVNFSGADLSNVDFRSAILTGANFSGADVYGANFVGSEGFETILGLETALNLDKALK